MAYIDSNYFISEYNGIEIGDVALLNGIIARASRDIDRITNYNISDFNELTAHQQARVKEAVASQVEYLILNGETASVVAGEGSFSIGAYSETGSPGIRSGYASNVKSILGSTGLLYRGISAGDSYEAY